MTEQLERLTSQQCEQPPASYDDLSVLMLNCTLTRSPKLSHTEGLLRVAQGIYEANRREDRNTAPGGLRNSPRAWPRTTQVRDGYAKATTGRSCRKRSMPATS